MSNPSTIRSKVSSKVISLSESSKIKDYDQSSSQQSEEQSPTIPEPEFPIATKINLTEIKEKKSRITMKVLVLTLLVPLLRWVFATELSTPFLNSSGKTVNNVPYSTREYWMKQAVEELFKFQGPCPFKAYGTVIVNHTNGVNELICSGANNVTKTGDPTQHGEMNAIRRCTRILSKKGLSPAEIEYAWKQLSLYTTAEPCPMCASAIRWAGFREYIYGTSIDYLTKVGWSQILIPSHEVVSRSWSFGTGVSVLGNVAAEGVTNGLFEWQFMEAGCPRGCERRKVKGLGTCVAIRDKGKGGIEMVMQGE